MQLRCPSLVLSICEMGSLSPQPLDPIFNTHKPNKINNRYQFTSVVLGIKARVSGMLRMSSATKLCL